MGNMKSNRVCFNNIYNNINDNKKYIYIYRNLKKLELKKKECDEYKLKTIEKISGDGNLVKKLNK